MLEGFPLMSEKKKDFFQLAIPLLLNHILEVQAKK